MPPVLLVALNITLVSRQVIVSGWAMVTVGRPLFWVIAVVVAAVQPFTGSVTVTTYVPAVSVTKDDEVTPLFHAKVALGVLEFAVTVILITLQVNAVLGVTVRLGVAIFCVTEIVAETLQPFAGLVTVTE